MGGDGLADFAVGAPGHDSGGADAGATYLYSGRDGAQLYRVDGASPGAASGHALAPAGDWNADGTPDLLVGAPLDVFAAGKLGSVRVRSGADASVLFHVKSNPGMKGLGHSVAVGDTDGDDHLDLLYVGVNGAGHGMVRIHRLLDGDGIASPVLVEPFGPAGAPPGTAVGHVTAFHSAQSWIPLIGGLAGVNGVPGLLGGGKLGEGSPVTVSLVNEAPLAIGRLVIGFSVAAEPFGGAALIPEPALLVGFVTSPAGSTTWGGGWPAIALAGTELWLQAWVIDPAAPQGLSASNGLLVTTP